MTLYVVPPRLHRRRRYLVVAIVVALVAAVVVGSALSRPSGAAAEQPVVPSAAPPVAAPPGLEGVDADLAARFTAAQAAAARAGVALTITSGKRSVQEQQQLVDDAIAKYGTEKEAHRWVLPPESSAHVQGLALDVGPTAGALWLGQHGLEFGLCRTYANEVWHFEKLAEGLTECPPMHPDSSSGW